MSLPYVVAVIFVVSILSPWFSVSMGSVALFRDLLVYLLLGFGAFVHHFSPDVIGVFFLALLLWGRALFLVVTSASLGSPVPFAKWSPFGTSQGLLGPLSR